MKVKLMPICNKKVKLMLLCNLDYHSRSESVETRQRKRTRDCLMSEKMGGAGRGRVRSASAGRDKRTEMACRY